MEHEDLTTWTIVDIADEIATCQNEMSRAYHYEDLTAKFADRSGKAFAALRDEEATIYRKLSNEFKNEAEIQRNTRHKNFLELRDRLFAELERRENNGEPK